LHLTHQYDSGFISVALYLCKTKVPLEVNQAQDFKVLSWFHEGLIKVRQDH